MNHANAKHGLKQSSTSMNGNREVAGGRSTSATKDDQTTTLQISAKQKQDYATNVLTNNQLIMRYAIANNLSVPRVRVYFEKVAAGFEPKSIIKNWDVLDD